MKTFTAIVLVAIVAVAIAKPLTRALTNRDNCGTQKVSNLRIVNGMNAYYGQFPWQISLQFKITSNRKMHVCGGSIIDDQWILTASHCFLNSKDPAKYVVRIGTFNQTAGSAEPEAVEHDLDKIIQHEGFKLILKIRNDIALIKLSKPINFDNEYVNTVCMPTDSKFNNVDGSELVVSGWGDTLPGSQTNVPDLLQWTKLTAVNDDVCAKEIGNLAGGLDAEQMVCAEKDDTSPCQGDSGGPLVINEAEKSRQVQIGVVSFGDANCDNAIPTVFTRVTNYLDWIEENMKANM